MIKKNEKRENKNGFVFENEFNLSDWYFPEMEDQQIEAFEAFEEEIENSAKIALEKLKEKIGDLEYQTRKIASEALRISFEQNISAHLWSISSNPELITIHFRDFAEDGYSVEVDLKKAIKQCLLNCCDDDGYAYSHLETSIIKFADMLKELEEEVRTAIRPKDEP